MSVIGAPAAERSEAQPIMIARIAPKRAHVGPCVAICIGPGSPCELELHWWFLRCADPPRKVLPHDSQEQDDVSFVTTDLDCRGKPGPGWPLKLSRPAAKRGNSILPTRRIP